MIKATDAIPPLEARLDAVAKPPEAQTAKSQTAKPPAASQARDEGKPRTEPEPNLRLTIDKAEDGLFYVYTIKDRETGRIISQLPRDELARVKDQANYVAGTVVNTKA